MSGTKTHQQQRQIIEKRVDTSNADKDFDPRPYLDAAEQPHQQIAEGQTPRRAEDDDSDMILRGENQESQHHKNTGKPADADEE